MTVTPENDRGPKTARNLGYGMVAVWIIAAVVTIALIVAVFWGLLA